MRVFVRPLSGAIIAFLVLAPFAGANYDRVVTWSDMSDLDLSRVLRSPYASPDNMFEASISPSKLEIALMDADNKIGPEFHVPAALKGRVEFWLKIYTEYSTQQSIL